MLEYVQLALEAGIDPATILGEGLMQGMKIVGEKFETGEFFIPDMLASAQAVAAVMDILKPLLIKSGLLLRESLL